VVILPRRRRLVPWHVIESGSDHGRRAGRRVVVRRLGFYHRLARTEARHDCLGIRMIKRRTLPLLAAAAALPALWRPRPAFAALPIPPGNVINSRVIRKDSDIGTAKYVFDRDGDTLRVHISVDLVVKLGPVPVFRYTHRDVETWQGDTLMSLEATTDDDGTPKFCSARRVAEGLAVKGSHGPPYVAPANALGTTYWNMKTISTPLINTEDGHLLDITMTPQGPKPFPLANGGSVPTREWEMTGDLHTELFYEADGRWAGMIYHAKDKSMVQYLRL